MTHFDTYFKVDNVKSKYEPSDTLFACMIMFFFLIIGNLDS